MTSLTLTKQIIAGIELRKAQPKNQTFQVFYNYLSFPGTIQLSEMKKELRQALQNSGFAIADCLLASYICLLLNDRKQAQFYAKLAQSGQPETPELIYLENLTRYMDKASQNKAALEPVRFIQGVRLGRFYEETEFYLFDILQQFIHTPPYQPRFEPAEQQTFMHHGLKRLEKALKNIEDRLEIMKKGGLLPEGFAAKVELLKILVQRYRKLERAMERFNKTSAQVSQMLKHTQNIMQKQRFIANHTYAQTIKMELKDYFGQMGEQLDLMEKLGYTVAPFLNYFLQLNEKVEKLFLLTHMRTA